MDEEESSEDDSEKSNMNSKRRDSNGERQSPDVYSTSSAASSTKNTNSHIPQVARPRRMNLQECLREMNSVMRVLDNGQLESQGRVDELNSVLDGEAAGLSHSSQSFASSASAISPEVEILLRNQQTLLKQIADSKAQLAALEQQYHQPQSPSAPTLRMRQKLTAACPREVGASSRVTQEVNALVERLKVRVEHTAGEYRRVQEVLEAARAAHRVMTPYEMEEDVFERGDPEGDAPASDDNNKMGLQSNPRFVRRMIPNGAPLSAPYGSESTTFEFPETPEQSDLDEKVRTLAETKQQIDALRGMISKLEGPRGPTPSKATPRPVPLYPTMNPVQQKRRQQLREINRSLNDIETLIHREVVGPKRNLSVSEKTLRSGARPRFNSCNVQPWDNYPLLEVPFRGSQPRSLTEAATWGGSSTQDTQDNSDNGEVQSESSDSEIERIAAFDPVATGARPKVRGEPAGAASHLASLCDGCAHFAAYTQMLTLSLVQANEVINGQQKEIERLKALLRPLPTESAPAAPGVRPLNNQVTPGIRANNYVDNLKSFSTLNLLSQPVERRVPPTPQSGERNDLSRDEERQRRKPNKNSMNSINQINFCRYSSNPELNREEENKAAQPQLSRERLEMQPALDAATGYLASKEGELCTPEILIQTCRCLLDQLTSAGVSHKHTLRVLQPTLGQFLARPVNPGHIVETLTNVLQQELAVLTKSNSSPSEQTSGAAVSGISDRSTAGNDQPEDADGASAGDAEGGEDMAEADQGTEEAEATARGRLPILEATSVRESGAQASSGNELVTSSTHDRLAPEDER